jgi:hypothetical protein
VCHTISEFLLHESHTTIDIVQKHAYKCIFQKKSPCEESTLVIHRQKHCNYASVACDKMLSGRGSFHQNIRKNYDASEHYIYNMIEQ